MEPSIPSTDETVVRPGSVWARRAAAAVAFAVILTYLISFPGDPLDRADWVAYAVCHRIPSHSLLLNERPLPLCARCTGTFLGATLAIGVLIVAKRRADIFPPLPVLLALFGFTALWAADGVNSYVDLSNLPKLAPLYSPQNWLRLLTGTLHGLTMGTVLYPVAMGTFWRECRPVPVLRNVTELGGLVLAALAVVLLAQIGWPVFLYPLALLSSAGVLLTLTLVNTVMLLILFRRENTADTWMDLWLPLAGGLTFSLLLVGIIAAVRYALTGTLTGLPGLPL